MASQGTPQQTNGAATAEPKIIKVFTEQENDKLYEALEEKVSKMIFWRKIFQWGDFTLAHTFIWVSVLASFASSIIIATKTEAIEPWQVAIIAGIPGLVIIIEKTFNFTKRSVWGTMYTLELEELKDEIIHRKSEPFELAKKLTTIKRMNELRFIRIGFFSQQKKAKKPDDE
jgi:hypothetical protein